MSGVNEVKKSDFVFLAGFAFFVRTLLHGVEAVDNSVDTCLILSGISATVCALFQLCRLVPKVVPSLIFGWNRFLLGKSCTYAVCSNVPVFTK